MFVFVLRYMLPPYGRENLNTMQGEDMFSSTHKQVVDVSGHDETQR